MSFLNVKSGNKHNVFMLIFLGTYLVLSLLLFDPKLYTGGDNAIYILLAESITSGKGYRDIYLPEEPPHALYPIGFPLFLSLFMVIFGTHFIVFKLAVLMTGIGAVVFMYKIGEHFFESHVNIIMPFFLSIPVLIIYNHRILSEIPFLFFTLGSIYFFLTAQQHRVSYLIACACAICAFFLRTAGIMLILGIVPFLVLRKQYKYLGLFLAVFLALAIPWYWRTIHIPGGLSYVDQLLTKNPYWIQAPRAGLFDLVIRMWNNFLVYILAGMPHTMLPLLQSPWVVQIIGVVLLILAVIGFVTRLRKMSAMELYFVLGILLMFLWHEVWRSERFLLPILPLYVLYVYMGILFVQEKIRFRYLIHTVTCLFVVANLVALIPMIRTSLRDNYGYIRGDKYAGYSDDWRHYFQVIDWIKENVPRDKIIMARKPEFVYLLSGNKSFAVPFSNRVNEIQEAIERSDYILFDYFEWSGISQRYLLPVLKAEPEKLEGVYQTDDPPFYLVKVLK